MTTTKATPKAPKVPKTEKVLSPEVTSLSPLMDCIHDIYKVVGAEVLKSHGVKLPPVIVTIARDETRKGDSFKAGHITTAPVWENGTESFLEMMITGDGLSRGAIPTFGTILHEMSHAYNIASGVKDVDSNGRHNGKFKVTAEQVFGLEISKQGSIGWSRTEVPAVTVERWQSLITKLDEAITLVSGGLKSAPKTKKKNKNLLVGLCSCPEPQKIRASAKVFMGGVTCDECETNFVPEMPEETEGD